MNSRVSSKPSHEEVYIGVFRDDGTETPFANPHLKWMFRYRSETPTGDARPFDEDRYVDMQARGEFAERLSRDQSPPDYLLRLRRADRAPMRVEGAAHAEREGGALRVQALMRDVGERKRLEDQARDLYHQLLQAEKLAALGQTISASTTS